MPLAIETAGWSLGKMCADLVHAAAARGGRSRTISLAAHQDVVDDPFWQVLVIALGLAVAAAMVMMGYWQLEVYRNQGQAAAERRAAAPPVPISSVARAGAPVKDGYGRSVTVEGSYDPALQLLVPVEDRTDQFHCAAAATRRESGGGSTRRRLRVRPVRPTPPSSLVHQVGVLLPSEEHARRPISLAGRWRLYVCRPWRNSGRAK